jgi:hypothetical protein
MSLWHRLVFKQARVGGVAVPNTRPIALWRRTAQPGLWFPAGAFSRARIYSQFIALQIDAIEAGRLGEGE